MLQRLLVWRAWLVLVVVVAGTFAYRSDFEYTRLSSYWQHSLMEKGWVSAWSNFDGVHYFNIASRGYIDEGRFLPLYPLLIRVLATPLSQPVAHFWAGLAVSHGALGLALYYLYQLLKLDLSQHQAKSVLWLIIAFPTAFFWVSYYSESLFLLLSVMSFYWARKKDWPKAGVAAALLAVTRLPGVLIILPLAIEYWRQSRRRLNWVGVANLLAIPVLLLAYTYFNFVKWGDPLFFVHAHGLLSNSRATASLVFPVVTLYRYLQILTNLSWMKYEFWVAVMELSSLVLGGLGLIGMWRQRLRLSYWLWAISLLGLPLLSGTLSGLPRYILPVFPVFMGLASFSFHRKKLQKLVLVVSLIFQAVLLSLFARGYFIS